VLVLSQLFSQLYESKRAEKTLELAIHKIKSKRVANILELVSSRTLQTWLETKSKPSKYKTTMGKKG
jgi:hypothetical protein